MVYNKGSILYRKGFKAKGVYIVVDGMVKQVINCRYRKTLTINYIQNGELAGYRSVMTNEPTCTTSVALRKTVICYIPGKMFVELLRFNKSLTNYLIKQTCFELARTNRTMLDLVQKSIKARTAQALLEFRNYFSIAEDNSNAIYVRRIELANYIGTCAESVIRILSEFKKSGLIEVERSRVQLIDERELFKIANVCKL